MVMAEIESQERGILKILIFLWQKRLDQTVVAEFEPQERGIMNFDIVEAKEIRLNGRGRI